MKRALTVAAVLFAFPAGVGVSLATGGNQGPPHPGCKPSGDTPQKCHDHGGTTTTVTEPGTTTTVTVTGPTTTVTGPTTTVTVPGPTPAPTVVVTPGPITNTVVVTITISGVPTSVTVPGTVPGTKPACVNTRKSAILGPLPPQFKPGMRVSITSNGHTQFQRVMSGRRVKVNLSNLTCGVYPIVIRHGKLRPAWRIWSLTGGNGLTRFWFPGLKGVSTF